HRKGQRPRGRGDLCPKAWVPLRDTFAAERIVMAGLVPAIHVLGESNRTNIPFRIVSEVQSNFPFSRPVLHIVLALNHALPSRNGSRSSLSAPRRGTPSLVTPDHHSHSAQDHKCESPASSRGLPRSVVIW